MGDMPRRADFVTVPCGHCLGCRTDQARQWAVRIIHESYTHPPAYFATLTYDPENLPENGSLKPEDTQLFFKRLRRKMSNRLSYFLCGEYGEDNGRPHYHAVLFGPDIEDRVERDRRNGAPVWSSDLLEETWGHGLCELTPVNYNAAAYVAGYVRKKVRQRDNPEHYQRVDPRTGEIIELQMEFARMSIRPAIGRNFISRYWNDVYPRDFVVMDGSPMKPPRYYDKWMETDHRYRRVFNEATKEFEEERIPGVECECDEHREVMSEVRYQRWKDAEEIGDEKLIMKERVHRARVNLFQRRNKV